MNIGQLKKWLENVPDDTILVVPVGDHGYKEVDAGLTTGLRNHENEWTEDFGEDITPEKEYGKRLMIVVVGED